MTTELDTLLTDVGHAKVIVSLKSQADVTEGETSLAAHFTVSDTAQATDLAAVAMSFASRKYKRPQALTKRTLRVYPHLGLALGTVDRDGAAALAADHRVDKVVPAPELSLIKPTRVEAAKASSKPTWGLERLRVGKLWEAGFTGKGVLVGHLDTGVDGAHPALRGAIKHFAEFDWAGDQVPGAKPWDSGRHGTHTAGTIAGRSTARGAFGVAPEAQLASALVIEGGQVVDRVLAGMDWILAQHARILSMSLGLRGYTPAFQVVIDALVNQGVLPVIAVGNEGPDTSRSPGNYANVLSIGACDRLDAVTDFSSSETFDRAGDPLVPDIVAPGAGILSCVPNKGYAEMDGTSMATPHIAGLAALLLQAKPAATVSDLTEAIYSSCRLPGGMTKSRANRGLPDAVAAFTTLMGHPPAALAPPPVTLGRGRPAKRSARRATVSRKPAAKKRSPRAKARSRRA